MGKTEYDAGVHNDVRVLMFADKSRLAASWGGCRCEAQWARMADKLSTETFLRVVHQQRARCSHSALKSAQGRQQINLHGRFLRKRSSSASAPFFLTCSPLLLDRGSFTRGFLASLVQGL